MRRLIYTSAATRPITPEMVADILRAAGRNNTAIGITGLLIAGDGNFFQVLEGEHHNVEATFARIQTDPRHSGALVLWDEVVQERLFPNWAMRWRELDPDDPLTKQIGALRTPSDVIGGSIKGKIPEDEPFNILLSVFLDSLGH